MMQQLIQSTTTTTTTTTSGDPLLFGWLLGLPAPVPARGPQAEKDRRKGRQRRRQKQQSQSQRKEEARGSATDGLFLCIGAPFPAKGRPERSRRDWEPEGWIVSCLGGFWACGPRSPPEGRKQRRPEGKEGNGDARSSRARAREEAQGRKPEGLQQTGFS